MVPFFGTNVTQSIDPNTYNSKLGHYTGNFTDGEYKSKEEVSEMFKPNEQLVVMYMVCHLHQWKIDIIQH